MTLLTETQVTEIADALVALDAELAKRTTLPLTEILTTTAGHLVNAALMRPQVPPQAYLPQPPYPYGPEDFMPGQPGQSVPLSLSVSGSNRQELEDRARAAGRQVFGEDAVLAVTLTGAIATDGRVKDGVKQYSCGATVREEASQVPASQHPVRYSDTPLG
jgi:hypothetical protein